MERGMGGVVTCQSFLTRGLEWQAGLDPGGAPNLTQASPAVRRHPSRRFGGVHALAIRPRVATLPFAVMSKLDDVYAKLQIKTGAKLALIVLDGLGDIATQIGRAHV